MKFLSDEFKLKLLDAQEEYEFFLSIDNPYDSVSNPFGSPDYFVLINMTKINRKTEAYKIRGVPQKFFYQKLITSNEFKRFPSNITYREFVNLFLEEDKFKSCGRTNSEYSPQILSSPQLSKPRIHPLKLETNVEYIERCKNKFKTDFIYEITLYIESTKEIEIEYKELPSKHLMKNNPDLPPIRVWKKYETIPDDENIAPLKDLVLDLCKRLEANGIFNYLISPNMAGDDMGLALDLDADLSWGDYDPNG